MSYGQDEEILTPQEATRHARRGACLVLLVLPLLCYCACWPLITYTSRGRMVAAYAVTNYTYHGLPQISFRYLDGFPDIAQAACDLDRQNPRPANYQQRQDRLKTDYDTFYRLYSRYWYQLQREGGDTSQLQPPTQFPGEFNSAKLYFCRR